MIGIPILVADDDEIARCLLVENLKSWGYAPITCPDGQAALEALRKPTAPQIAILDWNMPGLSGVEICRRLRESQPDSYTFVVLLTHRDQYADRITGLESGADDFVTKPFDPRELQLRLRTAVRILELQAQLEEARDIYRHEAESDELTGLWNRRSLFSRLNTELADLRVPGDRVSIVLVDVDEFKSINDERGHVFGDRVLRFVGQCLKQASRGNDVVARHGGDEFALLLPGVDLQAARRAAERFRLYVSSSDLFGVEESCPISVSVGVAEITHEHAATADEAIEMADQALYAAKRTGRNRVETFQEVGPATDADDFRVFP